MLNYGRSTQWTGPRSRLESKAMLLLGLVCSEDLQKVRLDVRTGVRPWIEVGVVRGFRRFSPELGLRIAIGSQFGSRFSNPVQKGGQ